MEKRGQLMSTPLMWAFALIVGGMIMIFGGYQIYKLTTFANEVQVNDFYTNLKSDVESYYYLDEGSSKVIKVTLPQGIDYICFKGDGELEQPSFITKNEMFLMESNDDNAFLFPADKLKDGAFSINYINVIENPLCIKSGQKLVLTSLENGVQLTRE